MFTKYTDVYIHLSAHGVPTCKKPTGLHKTIITYNIVAPVNDPLNNLDSSLCIDKHTNIYFQIKKKVKCSIMI